MRKLLVLACCAAGLLLASTVHAGRDDDGWDDDRGDHDGRHHSGRHHDDRDDVERHTRFGPIVGVDDSDRTGTYFWKGVPFAKPPVGDLRWKAPVDPDSWRRPRPTQQFGNACVQYGRIYGPGAEQSVRPHDRHDAEPGRRQRGLPLPQHLAPGRPARRTSRDRLRAWRKQRLGLYRRPDVRGRPARQGGQCGGGDGQLPARHLRLHQRAPAEVGRGPAGRFGQLRAARHHQGAAVHPARHRQVRRQPGAT